MAEKIKNRDMTDGVIWKELVLFFLPIAAGTLFQQLYNAVDAIIVGKFVGTEALAAVGGSPSVIINLIISVFVSLTTGSSVIIAQLYGAGKYGELKKATGTTVTFFLLLGAVLTLIFEPLTIPVLHLMGTPEETVVDAATYLYIAYGSLPLLMLTNALSGLLRAIGDSRSPFLYMLIACLSNIVLDLLFVIGFGMGVAGAAWATILSIGINALLATVKLIRDKAPYRIDVKALGIDRTLLKEMMGLGIPAALQGAMYGVSNAILQATVNRLGTAVVASWALTGKVDGVYWSVANSAGCSITTFAGQNYGAKKMDRVYAGFKTGFYLFMPMTVLVCIAILGLSPALLPLFTDDAEVIRMTYEFLWYFVPFYVFWTVIEIVSGTLRGCSEVRVPVLITGIGVCLLRVVWVYTVCSRELSMFNVAICYPITWIVTAIAMFIYYLYWKKKQTV